MKDAKEIQLRIDRGLISIADAMEFYSLGRESQERAVQ